jgi:FHA domain
VAKRTLRFSSGAGAGQEIEIEEEIVVGREGCDLTIDDPELSRRHVAFRPVENGVEVEDLGSLNGTFVDGRRITDPQILTAGARVKLGTSEGNLELAQPDLTRAAPIVEPDLTAKREVPEPDLTRAAPIVEPDVTAPREILEPDMTAQRPIAEPDVTAPREIPEPDMTAQRPIAEPDVTAPREIPEPDMTAQRPIAEPDVTAKRGIPSPDVTARRPVAEQGPPGGPTPPVPPPQQPADAGGRGGPPLPLIGGVVVALAVIVAIVLLASGGGDEPTKRPIDVTHELTAPTAADKRRSEEPPGSKAVKWKLTGKASGKPFGKGTDELFVTLQPIPKPPKGGAGTGPPPGAPKDRRARVSVRFVARYADGTITAVESLKTRRVAGGIEIEGTGRVISGTGEFEGATGTFKIDGSRPKFDESLERIKWTGSVEY